MIQYICDRCGKKVSKVTSLFTVSITPPEVWNYYDSLITYYDGDLHFCSDCMKKINECIEELGRTE